MQLKPVATFDTIEPEVFKKEYYDTGRPVVIKKLAHNWPAYQKWISAYFYWMIMNICVIIVWYFNSRLLNICADKISYQ